MLPPYRRQFFSAIRRQIWKIFDLSPPKTCRRRKWMVPKRYNCALCWYLLADIILYLIPRPPFFRYGWQRTLVHSFLIIFQRGPIESYQIFSTKALWSKIRLKHRNFWNRNLPFDGDHDGNVLWWAEYFEPRICTLRYLGFWNSKGLANPLSTYILTQSGFPYQLKVR